MYLSKFVSLTMSLPIIVWCSCMQANSCSPSANSMSTYFFEISGKALNPTLSPTLPDFFLPYPSAIPIVPFACPG